MKPEKSKNSITLPRGGYLVDTPLGYIQFSSPPETIKDTMRLPKGVPQIFVLPSKMFNWIKGISVAEMEFPIYYNFFIKKIKTCIVCNKDQQKKIKRVLQEAIFGPKDLDISKDYDESSSYIPDIWKEMKHFRNNLRLSDLISFGIFQNNRYSYNEITIEDDEDGIFRVLNGKKTIAEIPDLIEYKATYKIGERLPEPYKPSLFGITILANEILLILTTEEIAQKSALLIPFIGLGVAIWGIYTIISQILIITKNT